MVVDPELGQRGGIRESCYPRSELDVGGVASTNRQGQLRWLLSQIICEVDPRTIYAAPISFVATAMSASAETTTARIISTGGDVVIDVFSWDSAGNSAPNVRFSWRYWSLSEVPVQ